MLSEIQIPIYCYLEIFTDTDLPVRFQNCHDRGSAELWGSYFRNDAQFFESLKLRFDFGHERVRHRPRFEEPVLSIIFDVKMCLEAVNRWQVWIIKYIFKFFKKILEVRWRLLCNLRFQYLRCSLLYREQIEFCYPLTIKQRRSVRSINEDHS